MAKFLWSKSDTNTTIALFGGAVGAAGWIFGMVLELNAAAPPQPANIGVDFFVVLLCAVSVLFTGVFVWCLYLFGCRLSLLLVTETLLGASVVFGTLAILWIDARGLLPVVVAGRSGMGQLGNEIWEAIGRHVPPKIVYAVPLILLGMMGAISRPPCRRRWFSGDVQRGTPEGARPGPVS
jgi:hypothetical protein